MHCAKALIRSKRWEEASKATERPIPTMSEMIRDQANMDIPLETETEMRARYKDVLY